MSKKSFFDKLLVLLIFTFPFSDLFCFHSAESPELLGIKLYVILKYSFILILTSIMIVKNKKNLLSKSILLYTSILAVYTIIHCIVAMNINSSFNSIINELAYIFRFICPLILFLYIKNNCHNKNLIIKALLYYTLTMCITLIVSNITKTGIASYKDAQIQYNIFEWYGNKLPFTLTGTRGFFYSTICLTPILFTFPLILKTNIEKPSIAASLSLLLLPIATIMVGTRVFTFGVPIIYILSFITIVLSQKKDKKPIYAKKLLIYGAYLSIFYLVTIPYSPAVQRQVWQKYYYSNVNDTNITKDPELPYFDDGNKDTIQQEQLYSSSSDQKNDNSEKTDDSHDFSCEKISGISTYLYTSSYPCDEHLSFWERINKEPLETKSNNRYVQKEIFDNLFEEKNDISIHLFGISYSKTSSIFNYEKDLVYQYYSMGIFGIIILILPLIILPLKEVFYLIKNNQYLSISTVILLGIVFELVIAYFSGNTIDNLSVLFPLGILIGIVSLRTNNSPTINHIIPKKAHYIWVGNAKKPKIVKKCIKSWKKHLIDYEIIEWNEKNFDIKKHPFIEAAYRAKKWAFVSDYIRAYVIYHEGGIYLDTDVLLLDNFDSLLNNNAFVGFENKDHPFTAAFGAKQNHPFVKKILDYYDKLQTYDFNFDNNNTISVSNILISEYNCKKNNKFQVLKDDIAVYPDTILCNPSKDSIAIHIFTGTWLNNKKTLKNKIITEIKSNIHSKFSAEVYRKILSRKIK